MTRYECKKAKSVIIVSTLHPDDAISSKNNAKKIPETVLFYNTIKAGIGVVDEMAT